MRWSPAVQQWCNLLLAVLQSRSPAVLVRKSTTLPAWAGRQCTAVQESRSPAPTAQDHSRGPVQQQDLQSRSPAVRIGAAVHLPLALLQERNPGAAHQSLTRQGWPQAAEGRQPLQQQILQSWSPAVRTVTQCCRGPMTWRSCATPGLTNWSSSELAGCQWGSNRQCLWRHCSSALTGAKWRMGQSSALQQGC